MSRENYLVNEDGTHKFTLITGNNAALVKRVLETRENWSEQTNRNTLFSFRWAPTVRFLNFE